jgi:hypothetical protein
LIFKVVETALALGQGHEALLGLVITCTLQDCFLNNPKAGTSLFIATVRAPNETRGRLAVHFLELLQQKLNRHVAGQARRNVLVARFLIRGLFFLANQRCVCCIFRHGVSKTLADDAFCGADLSRGIGISSTYSYITYSTQ